MSSPNIAGTPTNLQTSNFGLGFFTLDKKRPLQTYCNPVKAPKPEETKIEALTLESFRKSISSSEPDATIFTTLTALNEHHVTVHKMVNQQDWFEAAVRDQDVRIWIEEQLTQRGDIYLVVGYCVIDHTAVLAKKEEKTPVPTPRQEPFAFLERDPVVASSQSQSSMSFSRTSEGNVIYAVQYQKLKFGLFTGRKLTRAQISMDIEWTLMNPGGGQKKKPTRAQTMELDRVMASKDGERGILSRARSLIGLR